MAPDIALRSLTPIQQLTLNFLGVAGAALSLLLDLSKRASLEGKRMTTEKNPILRRKSLELLKNLTQILQEIIGSGDEEGFRRLEEIIHAIDESRWKPRCTLH